MNSAYNFDAPKFNQSGRAATVVTPPVLKVASVPAIEFQLIENKDIGIVGRLFIPANCRNVDSITGGRIVYDSDTKSVSANHNSRTIEFTATSAEYERLFALYGNNSNLLINRVRTMRLLNTMSEIEKGFSGEILSPETSRVEVAVALENHDPSTALDIVITECDNVLAECSELEASLNETEVRLTEKATKVISLYPNAPNASAHSLDSSDVPVAREWNEFISLPHTEVPAPVLKATDRLASLAQLKGCSSKFLKSQLRALDVRGRSKLNTLAQMAEVLVGRVAISAL